MKKYVLSIVILIAIILIGYIVVTAINNEKSNRSTIIEDNLRKLEKEKYTLKFVEVTPFSWDKAFIIDDPFLNEEALDQIVGAQTNLDSLVTDLKRRIIFVNEGKFVYDYIYDIRDFRFSPSGIIELKESSTISANSETSKPIVFKID